MMSGKQIKVVAAVVILIVAGILTYRTLSDAPDVPSEVAFVCVASGKIYTLKVDDVAIIPAPNPDTGERTLLPCSRGKDGVYRVSARYRDALTGSLSDVNKYVDVQTLEVKPKDGS
jgi:hypothetical protein